MDKKHSNVMKTTVTIQPFNYQFIFNILLRNAGQLYQSVCLEWNSKSLWNKIIHNIL